MRRYFYLQPVLAIVFASLHVALAAVPVVTSGGSGEAQGMAAAIIDFPLGWLLEQWPGGHRILYGCDGCTMRAYVWTFALGGTAMWAIFGFLAGAMPFWLARGLVALVKDRPL